MVALPTRILVEQVGGDPLTWDPAAMAQAVVDAQTAAAVAQAEATAVQGPVGPEGPAGPPGPLGLTGGAGPAGAAGADGTDSTVPGPQGPAGNDGADSVVPGPAGPEGPQGPAGADSTVPGPQGVPGNDGADGAPGTAGADGADSTVPGPQGPAGNDGADGAQGIQGIQGPAGNDGATGPGGPTGPAGGSLGAAQTRNSDATTNVNTTGTVPLTGVTDFMDTGFAISGNGIVCNFTGRVRATVLINGVGSVQRANYPVSFELDGVSVPGESASGYIRNSGGHNESSVGLTRLIAVTTGQVITAVTRQEGGTGTVTMKSGDSILLIERTL